MTITSKARSSRGIKAPSGHPIFAIGHSTRPIGEFIKILKAHGVGILCDIRTIPRSRHNPQFNARALAGSLKRAGIKYRHLKLLGGLRRAEKDSINTGWKNPGFRGFADYMQTADFGKGLRELTAIAKKRAAAIMCAEGNPFRCHRSLVADALLARRIQVFHISSAKSARRHELTPFAKITGGKIFYPAKGAGRSRTADRRK